MRGPAMRKAGGFTLTEFVIVFLIIIILSGVGAFLMTDLMRHSIYIPNKLNMDMIAADTLDIIIEGDDQAGGLRFSRAITWARRNQVRFIDHDGYEIRIQYRNNQNDVRRRIMAGPNQAGWTTIPYYGTAATINRIGNSFFTYYDDNENAVNNPPVNTVRRVEMTLIASTGSGLFDDWQGQSQMSSSAAVNPYQ